MTMEYFELFVGNPYKHSAVHEFPARWTLLPETMFLEKLRIYMLSYYGTVHSGSGLQYG